MDAPPNTFHEIMGRCPAFSDGCPYASASKSFSDEVAKCPVFAGGCPFASLDGSAALFSKFFDAHTFEVAESVDHTSDSNPPESSVGASFTLREKCPAFSEGCPFKALPEPLREEILSCPSFASGCPFVNLTSKGEPLVVALGKRRWDVYMGALAASPPTADQQEVLLATLLKDGTKEVHALAETSTFVKRFRDGTIPRDSFAKFTAALYYVYSVMEEELEACRAVPAVSAVHFPTELNRTAALEKDLECWYGKDWRTRIERSPAASLYVERLRRCGKENPAALVAHSYTRYLGDMSGGQMLKRLIKRCFDDVEDDGLAFYEFENVVGTLGKFKNMYRKQLDSIRLSPTQTDEIVLEANVAFILNMQLFAELEDEQLDTNLLDEQFIKALHNSSRSSSGASAECPFAKLAKESGESSSRAGASQAASSTLSPSDGPNTWRANTGVEHLLPYIMGLVSCIVLIAALLYRRW